jgi:hypothetical protein
MRSIVICATVALCACSQSANQQPTPKSANPYDQRLQSLSVSARNLGLRNAIKDSGSKCERVDRSARQQDYKNSAMWVAHCADTGDYALFVTAQGSAQVIACDNLGEGAPVCQPPTKSGD